MSSRPPRITPSTITGTVDATHPDPQPSAADQVGAVPAQVGQTFKLYTTALGQALPAGVNRARAAVASMARVVR